jgi:hypothetical protein
MADERVVATKLEQIEQYHSELQAKQASLSRTQLLSDTTAQRAVERMVANVIQACSDLAQHVATHDFHTGSREVPEPWLYLRLSRRPGFPNLQADVVVNPGPPEGGDAR